MLGYGIEEIKNMGVENIHPKESLDFVYSEFEAQLKGARSLAKDIPLLRKDGSVLYSDVNSVSTLIGGRNCIIGFFRDVTKRKEIERTRALGGRILDKLNESDEIIDIIKSITILIKEHTGFQAVGIRLREGMDFPYYVTQGYPVKFIELENYLCTRDDNNEIIVDSEGKPSLDCMCGIVLSGKTDPSFPFFTDKGSFWINSTTRLLAEITENERLLKTRNRCNSEGYESVALIPIKSRDEIIGLLQINDSRQDCFNLDLIHYLEGLGASIGIAVERSRSIKAIEESEVRYREMFEKINDAVAVYGASDDGEDIIFLDVNKALEDIEK
jgi:PAS domain-containing protein